MALRTTRTSLLQAKPRQSKSKIKISHLLVGLTAITFVIYIAANNEHLSSNQHQVPEKDHVVSRREHRAKHGVSKASVRHTKKVRKRKEDGTAEPENNTITTPKLHENMPITMKLDSGFNATTACKLMKQDDSGFTTETFNENCRNASHLVAYNPMSKIRYLCGEKIPMESALKLATPCWQGSRLFPNDPDLYPKPNVEPIDIIEGSKAGSPINFDCDVPCNKWGGDGLISDKNIGNTNWVFAYSMESSGYYPNLAVDTTAWKNDRFYATTSFNSEIPLPYFSWAEYNIQQPGVVFDNAIKGASFIARNCGSKNDRESVVRDLTELIRVDSLSACLHNADPPDGMSMYNKKEVQKKYLFHLAFENTCEDDYITEKLWGTLESGSIPVYYGAPNVKDHAPPNSIISWHDFQNTSMLGSYLNKVAEDQKLYDSYHSWRYKPLPEVFINKFNFTHTHSICRMCRWAYARSYGFGWNHTFQTIQDTRISRKLCTNTQGLVIQPFKERWTSRGKAVFEAVENKYDCAKKDDIIQIGSLTRRAWSHDGVLDLHIDGVSEENFELEVSVPIKTDLYRKGANHFIFQDVYSRITILTRQEVRAQSGEPGVVRFGDVSGGFIFRVIIEDIDMFHRDAYEHVSDFADIMARDFWHPVEFYLSEVTEEPIASK
jgi:Glycosyltransferase family 10 (fucosyltransferase) C-term